MAKGLKLGDKVSMREDYKVPAKEPAFTQGLILIKKGTLGRIVEEAGERSFVVEFEGGRVTLSSQRLDEDRSKKRLSLKRNVTKRGPRAKVAPVEPAATPEPVSTPEVHHEVTFLDFVDVNNTDFLRLIANMLLMSGNSPNTVLLQELRFSDLPHEVQDQAQRLVRAKLALR
jgi:hypothetical protein